MSAPSYKRIQTLIDGPINGPFEITDTLITAIDGKIINESETIKVMRYNLTWDDNDVLN